MNLKNKQNRRGGEFNSLMTLDKNKKKVHNHGDSVQNKKENGKMQCGWR